MKITRSDVSKFLLTILANLAIGYSCYFGIVQHKLLDKDQI